MRKFLHFTLFFLMISIVVSAQINMTVAPKLIYKINKTGQTDAFLQIYCDIDPLTLHYKKTANDQIVADFEIAVNLKNDTGVIQSFTEKHQTIPHADFEPAKRIFLEHQITLKNSPIKLSYSVFQEHVEPTIYLDSFNLENNQPHYFTDFILIDTLVNKLIVPRLLNYFDETNLDLNYFIKRSDSKVFNKTYTQEVFISKTEFKNPILSFFKTEKIQTKNQNDSIYGIFHLNTLNSGNYYLNILLKDSTGKIEAKKSLFFQLSNLKPKQNLAQNDSNTKPDSVFEKINVFDLSKTFVNKYSDEQLKAVLKMILPISDASESEFILTALKNPDYAYIRYFIYNFFEKKNPQKPNQAWIEFTYKIKDLNKLFGSKSYNTDRGIIYLKYGKPDERVEVKSEFGTLPYEVWVYNALGKQNLKGLFLFYQPSYMGNDFKLLHSNVNGEIRNTNWHSFLYKEEVTKDINNSKAAFYFENQP